MRKGKRVRRDWIGQKPELKREYLRFPEARKAKRTEGGGKNGKFFKPSKGN